MDTARVERSQVGSACIARGRGGCLKHLSYVNSFDFTFLELDGGFAQY